MHCNLAAYGGTTSLGLVGGSAKFSVRIRTFTSHIGGLQDLDHWERLTHFNLMPYSEEEKDTKF